MVGVIRALFLTTTFLLREFYIGYSVSAVGAVVGLIYGFVDGFIGGWLLAWLYNMFAAKKAAD